MERGEEGGGFTENLNFATLRLEIEGFHFHQLECYPPINTLFPIGMELSIHHRDRGEHSILDRGKQGRANLYDRKPLIYMLYVHNATLWLIISTGI